MGGIRWIKRSKLDDLFFSYHNLLTSAAVWRYNERYMLDPFSRKQEHGQLGIRYVFEFKNRPLRCRTQLFGFNTSIINIDKLSCHCFCALFFLPCVQVFSLICSNTARNTVSKFDWNFIGCPPKKVLHVHVNRIMDLCVMLDGAWCTMQLGLQCFMREPIEKFNAGVRINKSK